MHIKIGSRASKLAMIQANIVASKLSCSYEIIPIITSGDKDLSRPLYDIGGKALFVKELEEALLAGKIDIAVHSLKDIPGILPEGLAIAAIVERGDPRDALISRVAKTIVDLPYKAKVGTSSPRRMAYLMHWRPDLEIVNLRGNVETRFNKILSGELDATILANAALKRIGTLSHEYCHIIDPSEMIPAIGQGAIAIETLESTKHLYHSLDDPLVSDLIKAERAFLEHIGADCRTPAAAYARMIQDKMQVDFMLAGDDLANMITQTVIGDIKDGYEIGKKMAHKLRGQ